VKIDIDPGSPEYPYVQLADHLRAEIAARRMGPRIPSLPEIAEASELSIPTVKRALKILSDEGLIVARPGRGTFVIDPPDAEKPPARPSP
jgi:DNA-binding GntR family transcriptional regulator